MDEVEIAYSMNFSGADSIVVHRQGCGGMEVEKIEQTITEPEKITKIIALLGALPTEGLKMIKMGPCTMHEVRALKGGTPFARIAFYEGSLRLENSGFGFEDEAATAQAEELFALIQLS